MAMDTDEIRRAIEDRTKEFGEIFYGSEKAAPEFLNSLAIQLGKLWKNLAQRSRHH